MRRKLLRIYRFLFAHRWAQELNYFFFDCSLRGLGVLNYETEEVSGERFLINEILPKHINQKPLFIDVGANIGRYSLALLARFPEATIHAFEPNPVSFAPLSNNARQGVICLNQGLSDTIGQLVLYDRSDHHGSEHASVYQEVMAEIHHTSSRSVRIDVTTLDEYCKTAGIEWVDFLKIDTEGHELKVAVGAQRMIAENRIGIIQVEFNEMNRISRCFYHDLVGHFPRHSFYRLLPSGLLSIPPQPLYQELYAFQNLIGFPKEFLRVGKSP